jgi:hypothetical protein
MEDEPQLAPGDELQCPGCGRWHEVEQPYAGDSTFARAHLHVTFASAWPAIRRKGGLGHSVALAEKIGVSTMMIDDR